MADASVTQIQVRCAWKLLQFFGRELKCPQLTNAKVFLVSIASLRCFNLIVTNDYFLWIPTPLKNGAFCLSLATTFFESYGIVCHVVSHYSFYFSNCRPIAPMLSVHNE